MRVEDGGEIFGPFTLGGGKECKISGGCDGVNPAAKELDGRGGEDSRSTTGGELGSSGGASGKVNGGALTSVSATLGKYPPPSDMVRSEVDGSNGDTGAGAAL